MTRSGDATAPRQGAKARTRRRRYSVRTRKSATTADKRPHRSPPRRYKLLQRFFGAAVGLEPSPDVWAVVVRRHFLPGPSWVLTAGNVVLHAGGRRHWRAREYYVRKDPQTHRYRPAARDLVVPYRTEWQALRPTTRPMMVSRDADIERASMLKGSRESTDPVQAC